MKTCLLAFLITAGFAHGEATNIVGKVRRETWYSPTELERVAKNYAGQKQIQFTFEGTMKHVSFRRVGTNTVATIDFFSGFGRPCFTAYIDQSGHVLTNSLGITICGTGRKP
jgi:hypothetical protein